jgi:hypothetical protein
MALGLPSLPKLPELPKPPGAASGGKPAASDKRNSCEGLFGVDATKSAAETLVYDPKRWYQIWPFEIAAINAKDGKEYIYALPIPPEAISISNMVASEATATLGGVVEETSENTFWMIQFQGTTGCAINRPEKKLHEPSPGFRQVKGSAGMISGALDQLENAVTGISDGIEALSDGDLMGGLNTLAGNRLWFTRSAVSSTSNGYYEILQLHKFLQMYSVAKEKEPDNWKLSFRHHKMNHEWQVVLKEFRVMQSKDRPYLYQYSIAFKGWNLKNPDALEKGPVDRFAKGGDLYVANTLTITGVLSKLTNMAQTARKGPAAIVDSLVKVRPTI